MAIVNKPGAAKHVDPSGRFVTPNTIFRWYRTEGLPCIRLGGRVLFNTESIDKWLKEREAGPKKQELEYGKIRRIE